MRSDQNRTPTQRITLATLTFSVQIGYVARPAPSRRAANLDATALIASGAPAMREKIRLVSTAGTGFFYTTTKNRKNTPEKLLLKKYDPKIRQYVDFKEAKIK